MQNVNDPNGSNDIKQRNPPQEVLNMLESTLEGSNTKLQ